MDLSYNLISGSIPYTIENLQNLQYLYIHSSGLTGFIPYSSFGYLTQLKELALTDCSLRGGLPDFVARIQNLAFWI